MMVSPSIIPLDWGVSYAIKHSSSKVKVKDDGISLGISFINSFIGVGHAPELLVVNLDSQGFCFGHKRMMIIKLVIKGEEEIKYCLGGWSVGTSSDRISHESEYQIRIQFKRRCTCVC